jgi:hypothetical protein
MPPGERIESWTNVCNGYRAIRGPTPKVEDSPVRLRCESLLPSGCSIAIPWRNAKYETFWLLENSCISHRLRTSLRRTPTTSRLLARYPCSLRSPGYASYFFLLQAGGGPFPEEDARRHCVPCRHAGHDGGVCDLATIGTADLQLAIDDGGCISSSFFRGGWGNKASDRVFLRHGRSSINPIPLQPS